MSLPNTIIKITAGTLPPNFCYPGAPQSLLNAFVQAITAQFQSDVGNSFYNMGTTVPTADNRIYPWLNLNDGRWYIWGNSFGVAKWITLYDGWTSSDVRLMWTGAEADLVTFDGGDAGTPGIASGPFWEVDHNYDARSPMGAVNTLPISGTPFTVGTSAGEEKHTQTVDELATHNHPISIPFNSNNVTDSTPNIQALTADANPYTGTTGNTGSSTPFNVIHPVLSTFFIKRTARQFRAI